MVTLYISAVTWCSKTWYIIRATDVYCLYFYTSYLSPSYRVFIEEWWLLNLFITLFRGVSTTQTVTVMCPEPTESNTPFSHLILHSVNFFTAFISSPKNKVHPNLCYPAKIVCAFLTAACTLHVHNDRCLRLTNTNLLICSFLLVFFLLSSHMTK